MNDDCILWPADHVKPNGYGWLMHNGRIVYAHRFVMGEPEGQVGHACHDRAAMAGECAGGSACLHRRCVNPDHLVVQTAAKNLASSPHTRVFRKFATHCARGHEFTEANTEWGSTGKGYRTRKCRTCKNEQARARYIRRERQPRRRDAKGRFT